MRYLSLLFLFVFNFLIIVEGFSQHINAYARVTGINTGTRVITLGSAAERNYTAHTFAVGEKVFIMQMQDDVIGSNTANNANFGDLNNIENAGRFEISTITAVTGNPVTSITVDAINNSYNLSNNTRVQVISLRSFAGNYTTTSNITALPWDGNIGGIIALEVENTLTLAHNITADSAGFIGGEPGHNTSSGACSAGEETEYRTNDASFGFKGEGIYRVSNNNYLNRRGKILTGGGGGNYHNAGGGGGGNFAPGGLGGNGWGSGGTPSGLCQFVSGGIGGISLSNHISSDRLFLGGGGGGGQGNEGTNQATKGGNGGGAIFIKANTIQTSGSCAGRIISANGQDARPTSGNDGGGGGGAGGSIVFHVNNWNINENCELLISANGSNGSRVTHAHSHGGGGGGGQGLIFFNTEIPTENITTHTFNGIGGCNNEDCDSKAGDGGDNDDFAHHNGIFGFISTPLPAEVIFFRATKIAKNISVIEWATSMELNNSHFTILKSLDGQNWTELGSIQGNGNSDQYYSYELHDYNLKAGLNYYKLIQTDFDGKSKEHGIRVIEADILQNQVIIQPNPSDGLINIQFSNLVTGGRIEILNTLGQVLVSESFFSSESSINLPETSGVYLLRVTFNGQVQTHRVVRN